MKETASHHDDKQLKAKYNSLLDKFSDTLDELKELKKKYKALSDDNLILRKALLGILSEKRPKLEEANTDQLGMWEDNSKTNQNESPKTNSQKKKRKKRPKEQNRKPLPDHLPREVEVIELPEEECKCGKCGAELLEVGEEISEQLEYQPAVLKVKQIRRKKYACKDESLHGLFRCRLPNRIIPKGIAGPSLLSHILISKYIDHLPLERIEKILLRSDVHIPKSSMSDWMGKLCSALNPLMECLKNKMLDSRILNADETTFKVQQNSKQGPLLNGYLWSFIGNKKWVWYEWKQGRNRFTPLEVLEGFTGEYLQTDGYAAYNAVSKQLGLEQLGCWAHARRGFIKAEECGYKEASDVLDLIADLYRIERECKENEYTDQKIRAVRRKKSVAILEQIKAKTQELRSSALPKGELGKALTYLTNQWESLIVFTEDGDLEIDNNMAERAFRPTVLGRKNYLFAGSKNGAQWAASFYSLIETAKLHGVDPAAYLTKVIYYLADYEGEDMTTLLPDAYAAHVLPQQ